MKKISFFNRMKNRIRSKLFTFFQRSPRGLKYLISKIMYKPKIGRKVSFYGYGVFGPNVTIDDYSYFNDDFNITNIKIGKYVRIAKHFKYIPTMKEYEHFSNYKFWGLDNSPLLDYVPLEELDVPASKCFIGHDVWIGENVTILGNVIIGNGAVIGANSVVTKDVESYSIVVGNPARKIKYRLEEHDRDFIEKHHWWDWTINEIYEKYDYLRDFKDFE